MNTCARVESAATPFTPLQAAAMSALIVITGLFGGLSLPRRQGLGRDDR
jgi:predicted CDP-diglyceride synthetase/phosphatidate cytidylyltransferase